jgi:hypothetical protein
MVHPANPPAPPLCPPFLLYPPPAPQALIAKLVCPVGTTYVPSAVKTEGGVIEERVVALEVLEKLDSVGFI